MQLVKLPVAPITFKILSNRYAGEPIKPPKKDILYKNLWFQCPDFRNQTNRIRSILTEEIEIMAPRLLADHLSANGYQVGYYLYSMHVDEMCEFAFAQKATGLTPALTAIRKFRKIHNITEDDFPLDTAYKRWQRFILAKKRRKLDTNPSHKRVEEYQLYGPRIPKRGIKLKARIAQTVRKNLHHFILQDGTPDERLLKKAIIFHQYKDGAYKIYELCNQHDLSRPTVFYHLRTFREKLHAREIILP